MDSHYVEPVCLDDFQELARRNLSRKIFGYFADGSEEEKTVNENRDAFKRIKLRPRMLCGIFNVDMRTTILGQPISMPICIAPTALHKCAHPDGEIATARAAAYHDTCMALSFFSTYSMEDVATAAPNALKWFLVYMLKDKEDFKAVVKRAEDSGYKAIVICVDSPLTAATFHRTRKRYGHLLQPGDGIELPHIPKFPPDVESKDVIEHVISWKSVDWVKSVTRLPIVLKGILTAEDAKLAVEHGADGIIVSNHGGRQLDGVPATIDVLPEIVQAVQGKLEIYMDGGVRLGTDVFKALALGARAVFLGRPVPWGLAYKGEQGVRKVLELIREEFRLAMILSGCGSLADISKTHVICNSKLSML